MIFQELEKMITDRKANERQGSYTSQLLTQKNFVERKVHEELYEVLEAVFTNDRAQLIYELGDLFYHLLVLLGKYGISVQEVEVELMRRRK